MSNGGREEGVFDPVGWSRGWVIGLGVLTAFSLAFLPILLVWMLWVTFYPLPYTGTTAPPDVLATIPVVGVMGIAACIALLLWIALVVVNARTAGTKALWALAVLAGGGVAQVIAYFVFVWNPWHAAHPSTADAVAQGT